MVDLVAGPQGAIDSRGAEPRGDLDLPAGLGDEARDDRRRAPDHLITPNSRFTVPYSINVGGYTFAGRRPPPDREPAGRRRSLPSPRTSARSRSPACSGSAASRRRCTASASAVPTGLNWPGESAGHRRPARRLVRLVGWRRCRSGPGEAVTPMQILDAYNSVANGGVFVTPQLVAGDDRADGDADARAARRRAPGPRRRRRSPSSCRCSRVSIQRRERDGARRQRSRATRSPARPARRRSPSTTAPATCRATGTRPSSASCPPRHRSSRRSSSSITRRRSTVGSCPPRCSRRSCSYALRALRHRRRLGS